MGARHIRMQVKYYTVQYTQRIKSKAFITLFHIFIQFSCHVPGYVTFRVTAWCRTGAPYVTQGLPVLLPYRGAFHYHRLST